MMFFDQSRPNKYSRLKRELTPLLLKDNKSVNEKFLTRKRYGKKDGSYVLVPELIKEGSAVLSYGIGDDPLGVSFEQEIGSLGHHVFMYDGSVIFAPAEIENGTFRREYLSESNFCHHVAGLDENGENHILKMDIEGHEYKWLSQSNLELLAENFAQFTVEVHSLIEEIPDGWVIEPQMLAAKQDLELRLSFFKKLNSEFHLFHIHANNHSPRHLDFPDSLELTYVNKKVADSVGVYPFSFPIEGLDEPNFEGREDYVCDWWV